MEILALIAIVISIIAISRSNDALTKITELKKQLRALESSRAHTENFSTSATSSSHDNARHDDSRVEGMTNNESHLKVHLETSPQKTQLTHQTNQNHQPYQVKHVPYEESAFVKWLKEDWLLKLGGVLVIMGVLFFLSLAFNAVGPQGKVAIGYIFGVSLMSFGFWYAKKRLVGGSAVHLIGAVVVIITTYVARLPEYNLFDPYVAMLLMFVTSVCVALTALAHNRPELAHVGLIMSALVPILVSTGNPSFFGLLVYLLVVILGVLWLALVTKWRSLVLLALLVVSGYSILAVGGSIGQAVFGAKELYMIALFAALFYITSLFSIFRGAGIMEKYDALVALGNAGFMLFWIIKEASPEAAPIIIAFLSLAYALGFFLIYKLTSTYTSFIVYGGVALGMLTTSIILEFSGRSTTVILLLMGAGATVLTYYLSKDEEVTKIMAFFNIVPLIYVITTIGTISRLSYPTSGVLDAWKDFLILGLAILIYQALYKYFVTRMKGLSYVALTVVIILLMDVVWQALHLMTTDSFATELSFLNIGVGLTIFTYRFSENRLNTEKVFFVNALAGIGTIPSIVRISESISNPNQIGDIWKDWSTVFLVMTVAFAFYFFFIRRLTQVAYASLIVGLFLVVTSIWQLLHLIIPSVGVATFVSILIYTIVGLYHLWKGSLENNETKIKISRVWLGFVAARVILIDAWQSNDVTVGVLICIVIGILLLSSAFIIKKATTTIDK